MKKILITGADSYIGVSFERWLNQPQFSEQYQIDTLDMRTPDWTKHDFSKYDTVFHVAGIAHQKETKENAPLYYEVNYRLAVKTAQKAKEDGVRQFILLSSMSVYGKTTGVITKDTKPQPRSHYGKAKLMADTEIQPLADSTFHVAILRPPMVYGDGCKGNYQTLRKFALKSPLFPDFKNERSMLFIDGLSAFVQELIDRNASGLFFPQDTHYVCTAQMVVRIAGAQGKRIRLTKIFNPFIRTGLRLHITLIEKVFGSLVYELSTGGLPDDGIRK